jgi:hypothetical protein
MPRRRIVITDLTRFSNGQDVCIAGTDLTSGECIRPLPYLTAGVCQQLNILPGAILSGEFARTQNVVGPHQEDHSYSDLRFEGACSSEDFRQALEATLFNNVSDGFEINLTNGQKYLPQGHNVGRSIITLQIEPENIWLVEDAYNRGRIKVHFTDDAGDSFRYLPITDLGFYRYAMEHHAANDLQSLNDYIHGQDELFIRLGLTRFWQKPSGDSGYWMQVNGIYTFPDYHREIRSYG